LTGSKTVNTLRIVSTADNQVLNIGANILSTSNLTGNGTSTGGGILYAGGANGNYTINGTGSLRIFNQNGQGQLINVHSGTLTVDATIGSGSSPLVKSGEGTLVVNKALSTGAVRVYQGVLRVTGAGTLIAGSTVQNGAAIELGNGIAIANTSTLNITGTGVSNGGALRNVATTTSSYAAAITIGTGGARINSDTGTLTLTGGVVTASGNDVTFGGASNINVNTAAISGSGGLVKDGAGNTTLNFTNSYSGLTRIDNGTLTLGHATNTLANTGAVNVNGGILALGSNTDTVGAVILTSGSITGSGAGTLTGTSYDVRSGTISAKLGNSLAALTKTTAGTVILSGENSYTGITTISDGTLEIWSSLASSGIVNNAALIFDNALSQSYLNAISGSGTFTKKGAGMLTLSAANTYTGATQVTGGVLNIASTGSTDVNSAVTVSNSGSAIIVNGTLGGSLLAEAGTTVSGFGTITGNTTISGIHNPGNSPGIQTYASNLTYSGGLSVVNWELNANTSTNLANPDAIFDQIIVDGNLSFSGSTALNLVFNGSGSAVNWSDAFWDSNQSWTLYDVAGNTDNFVNLNLNISDWLDSGGNLFSTTGGSFSLGQSGQDVVLNYAIPEPGAALLGGLGVLLLLRRRR
jgi:autotransporter-associated beta strand protein